MDFTQSQFADFFETATWSRGVAYAREGRVLTASMDETNQIAAGSVRGSGRNVYRQTIRFALKSQGAIDSVSGGCTCPIGHNCKHVAAVCHSLLSRGSRFLPSTAPTNPREVQKPAANKLPPQLSSWLGDLQAAQSQPPDQDIWPQNIRDRLLYIVKADGGRLAIETMKGHLLKDGSFSTTAKAYELSRIDTRNVAKFIRRRRDRPRALARTRRPGFAFRDEPRRRLPMAASETGRTAAGGNGKRRAAACPPSDRSPGLYLILKRGKSARSCSMCRLLWCRCF